MKTCRSCKGRFEPRSSTQVCCKAACAIAFATIKRIRKAKKAEKAARLEANRDRILRKRALETTPELTKKAQAAFNRFIRLRDAGKPCISCHRPLRTEANSYDAGHYRSVGSAPHLRFEENNCHAQCKHCNHQLSGNAVAYRQGLLTRIGVEALEAVESDNASRKYSKDELRELIQHYKARCKEMSHEMRS